MIEMVVAQIGSLLTSIINGLLGAVQAYVPNLVKSILGLFGISY